MQKKIPTRKCVGCGEMRDKKEMIRVIKTPEGEIRLDVTGRANGRGAYICNSAECLKKAVKNRGLEKSLKAQIPGDILEQMNKELGE
ncbi:MAG: YlxR family protein [Butyrivibrio sp.]|nr:YlxR family protein [Butyrivibrio sp.]